MGWSMLLAAGVVLSLQPHVAQACWNSVLSQCWDQAPSSQWQVATNQTDRWGIQNRYFDTHMCQNDIHAAWILGFPTTNDPAFTPYPPNLDTYLTWGPLNLAQAQAAAASFWMFNRSEPAHDSIFWGAATTRQLTTQNMMIAGTYSGDMNTDWELKYIDFAHLRNPAGDTISYLGQQTVYVFWRFRSDGNPNPANNQPLRFGALIDNISLSVDDGGVDLQALPASLLRPNGEPHLTPVEGDSAMARFSWMSCSGGTGNYPDYRVRGVLDNGTVVLDTVISGDSAGASHIVDTRPWVMVVDTHTVRFVVDTLNQVGETDETNNVTVMQYVAAPIHVVQFNWITPSDTVYSGQQTITLRWNAQHNPRIPATVSLYSSTQSSGCTGAAIPDGSGRPVVDGEDSLSWDLSQYGWGVPRYVFIRWHDAAVDSCIYAPRTVIRLDADARQGGLIPERFYLAQNYPNPFNPATGLEFGVARSGHVSLKVFDLLGREVAVLVNGQRSPGVYRAEFDGSKLPSGLYLYTLRTPEGTQTRKMMLLK
ncbi:MAG TPA: T9SS type A sorting domain-containing protein [bacterium]